MTLFQSLTDAARKRSHYMRTLRALRSMPLDTALDLDIYRGDADKIARRTVYGL